MFSSRKLIDVVGYVVWVKKFYMIFFRDVENEKLFMIRIVDKLEIEGNLVVWWKEFVEN